MKLTPLLLVAAVAATSALAQEAKKPLGYQDTPINPGTPWHVHDGERPQPPVVTPGTFPTAEKAGTPPSDAVVLFNGQDLGKWSDGKNGAAQWKVENGYAEVVPKTGDIITKDEFGPDMQLHVEWASPNPPKGDSQGRGNSGIFFYGKYETQVLDSFDNPTYPDGSATAVYGYMPPQVNATKPPGEWQAYDIIFEGPRFKDGKLERPAYVTVLHNGVVTQAHTALMGETFHKRVGAYKVHGEKGPIKIQNHGDPVRFRNIWIRELKMPGKEDLGEGPKIGQPAQ